MDVTVEKITEPVDPYYTYAAYTVNVEGHRILTIVSDCDLVVTKWLKEAIETNNAKFPDALIVGVAVDRRRLKFTKYGEVSHYELLQLCTGSHCYLYLLPEPSAFYTPLYLRTFFSNPKVIAAGMNMKSVAEKLERDHEIKFRNVVDLNELAVKAMKTEQDMELGLMDFDLDQLAEVVFGIDVRDPMRPSGKKLQWCDGDLSRYGNLVELRTDKVKYATVDTYLCFKIGWELLHHVKKHPKDALEAKKKKKLIKMKSRRLIKMKSRK